MRARWLVVVLVYVAQAACERTRPAKNLDLDLIRVSTDARLRSDMIGGNAVAYGMTPGMPAEIRDYVSDLDENQKFAGRATFVLADAENTGGDPAMVTLGGDLRDGAGAVVGALKPESLWIPPGESRTFALIEATHSTQPSAVAAQIKVRGAVIREESRDMRLEHVMSHDDYGKTVVEATLVNTAGRLGKAIVLASFHASDHRPMTRPFSVIRLEAHEQRRIQFVGPVGSTTGTLYLGDLVY